jgi:hypothetical protein
MTAKTGFLVTDSSDCFEAGPSTFLIPEYLRPSDKTKNDEDIRTW